MGEYTAARTDKAAAQRQEVLYYLMGLCPGPCAILVDSLGALGSRLGSVITLPEHKQLLAAPKPRLKVFLLLDARPRIIHRYQGARRGFDLG